MNLKTPAHKNFLKKNQCTTKQQKKPELMVDVSYVLKDSPAYDALKQDAKARLNEYIRNKRDDNKRIAQHLAAVIIGAIILLVTSKLTDNASDLVLKVSAVAIIIAVLLTILTLFRLILSRTIYRLLSFKRVSEPKGDKIEAVVEENKDALYNLFTDFLLRNNHNAATTLNGVNIEFDVKTSSDDFVPPHTIRIIGGYEAVEGVVVLFLTLRFNVDYTELAISDYTFSLLPLPT